MNTKKKNKKPNKPNPNPVQKVENVSAEKIQEVTIENPEILPKSEERVPEIISEVPLVIEANVPEPDTPKKPKRNRGKKKKSDKDDNFDDEPIDPIIEDVKAIDEVKDDKKVEIQKEPTVETVNLAPTARKKKNKNKKSAEQLAEEQKIAEQELNILPMNEDEVKMSDVKIVTLVPVLTEAEQESKAAKKKNKKKKRNDSEKSDKADEALMCTSAFQKLLEPREDKKEIKEVGKGEESRQPPSDNVKTESTIKAIEIKQECVLEKKIETEEFSSLKPEEKSQETMKDDGGKGKKKNKKDKKHPPKQEPETYEDIQKPEEKTEAVLEEKLSFTQPDSQVLTGGIFIEQTAEIQKGNPTMELPEIEKEKSPKPKAKIAKPVEKKRKEKYNIQNIEFAAESTESVVPTIPSDEKIKFSDFPELKDDEKAMLSVAPVLKETELKETKPTEKMGTIELEDPAEKDPQPITSLTTFQTDTITVPGNVTGKKRNKSPKPSKRASKTPEPATMETTELKDPAEKVSQPITSLTTIQTDTIAVPDNVTGKKRNKSPKPSKRASKTPEPATMETIELEDPAEKVSQPITSLTTIKTDTIAVPDNVTGKKRNKSPKPSKRASKTPEPATMETIELENPAEKVPQPITSLTTIQTDTIAVPDNVTGKKRNKSPKPSKRASKTPEPAPIKPTDDIQECVQANKSVAIPLPFEPFFHEKSELPTAEGRSETIDTKTSQDTVMPEKDTIHTTEEIPKFIPFGIPVKDVPTEMAISEETSDVVTQSEITATEVPKVEHMHLPETGKKRKKSPKMPRKFVSTPEVDEDIDKNMSSLKPDKTAEMQQESKEKTETPPDLPPLEDIEIRSVKAEESEGSSCDIVPDVHYPRASSQLQDDNNNMVIREVTGHETKLNIPIAIPDTPFIEGSGETPTPEIIPSGIRVTEIEETDTKPDERMDLKSKVIEVNQDMEELRLSIERSLAELTSMEKGERETEQQFEKAHAKIEQITEIASKSDTLKEKEKRPLTPTKQKVEESKIEPSQTDTQCIKPAMDEQKLSETTTVFDTPIPPVCPARKDNKGKGKSKKKGKHEAEQTSTTTTTTASETTTAATENVSQETKKEDKSEQKTETQEKGKQQSTTTESDTAPAQESLPTDQTSTDFVPIENFEDAMTSSLDDVNKSFEIIANQDNQNKEPQNNPEINVTAPIEDDEKEDNKQEKINPVSPPKNLRGHPDIPVRLNKTDYKKEKNKTPNTRQAKVKIKDDVPIEINKESKESQTDNRRFLKDRKSMNITETISSMTNENEEYIYKYSFRKVYLPNACHVCKKDFKQARVPCNFCSLVFYCSQKHKDEDYGQHQALCFAVSTIVHLKDQKHIYADSKDITGHNYRLLRMQMIVSCEKVLKRKLVPWEQEALLYPRMCGDTGCREWRQGKLVDCDCCGQISYCADNPDHLPKSHQRWCKSYSLYQRLVCYQQTKGRLEPKLPSRVMLELYQIPEKMNEILASMYEEKIDMNDIQYAALTQIATAPLTAAYCQQIYSNKMNSTYANGVHKKSSFTIHVVGAELQFEADALNKWEVFFLHLRPDVKDLRVVLIGPDLNPSNLPLDLLGKIKLCENCRQNKRRVMFEFQDKKTYSEYWSTEFAIPDLVCTFNPSIQRSSIYNGNDSWPSTIRCILKLKVPFVVTSYTLTELQRDLARIKECSEDFSIISEPKLNTFASVRPDRNFISDDEMPLLFKNYCFMVVCGGF